MFLKLNLLSDSCILCISNNIKPLRLPCQRSPTGIPCLEHGSASKPEHLCEQYVPLTMPVINLENSYFFFFCPTISAIYFSLNSLDPIKLGSFKTFCLLLDSAFLSLEDIQELQPSSSITHQFELLLEREFAKKMVKL